MTNFNSPAIIENASVVDHRPGGTNYATYSLDGVIYFIPAVPGSLEYAALVHAIGFSSKLKIGGGGIATPSGHIIWIATREGLKRYFETRRAMRLGQTPEQYYSVNPDGSIHDAGTGLDSRFKY